MQFITRYLFALFVLFYFNAVSTGAPFLLSLTAVNTLIGAYVLFNTWQLFLAYRSTEPTTNHRFLMWIDIGMITIGLTIDPNTVPLTILAYVLIILGNGMRYGMTLFREALAVTFVLCALALSVRYGINPEPMSGGVASLVALAAFIVIYCYALMERIDASQRELVKLSRFDALTGLLNRRGLFESAELVMQLLNRGNHHLTVIFADLDRFKLVNDTKGHAEGDRVLRAVGRMLKRAVRGSDLVARYGGDEFVLILPDATSEQAVRVTATLRRQINELVAEVGVPFGASFGIRQVMAGGTDLHQLLVEVDREMYRAKHGNEVPRATAGNTVDLDTCGQTTAG